MVDNKQVALADAAEWLGDWHPLAEQLGSADNLRTIGSVSALLGLKPVQNLASLRQFLRGYHKRILVPFELPAIQTACGHALTNELRELIALDQALCDHQLLRPFAGASQRVGRAQLCKLRPLRDHRLVRRYLQAVESGRAAGWHTLVYGVTLAVYSLPTRQGLLGYAHQTTRGFIYSAARMLHLSERSCRNLFDELCSPLPETVETLIRQPQAA